MEASEHIALLERTFQNILITRMSDVPVINSLLNVKAVGFHPWEGYSLGVLITPWFMNVILLPEEQEVFGTSQVGITKKYNLPSGDFNFTLSHEDQIGYFLTCSLFSPMFEFDSQEAAELTALESLIAILKTDEEAVQDKATNETPPTHSRRNFLRINKFAKEE